MFTVLYPTFLSLLLLKTCPNGHCSGVTHGSIATIKSFKEVDFDQVDTNALVIFDADDTLIFDIVYKGTIREQIFKKLKHRLSSKTLDILSGIIYEKRLPILVEPNIVDTLRKLKTRHVATVVLTNATTEKFAGLDTSFEDWRIQDLAKTGLVFNDPFKKTIAFNHLKGCPMLKAGIIFTADHDKGAILRQIFKKLGCSFNKIIFFDDKKENVFSVAKAAEILGIGYQGYVYKGAEFAPKPKLDKKIEEYRFSILEKEHVWLTQQEALERLNCPSY